MLMARDYDAQIRFLEEKYVSKEDKVNGLKLFFASLVDEGDFSSSLASIEKMLASDHEWLDVLEKLQIVEQNILHCSEEVYLFELIGVIRGFLNKVFTTTQITKEMATQIVKCFRLMAEVFAKYELFQASIDLYRDAISIATSFRLSPSIQASIIYDSLCLYEIQDRLFDAFDLAYLGFQTVEESQEKAWKHLFERTIESIGRELIPIYVKSAHASLWKGDTSNAKNFILSALRNAGILLKAKGTTNSTIRNHIDQIRTAMTMQRFVAQEEAEIIEILEKILVNHYTPQKVRAIGNGLIGYYNLASNPSISVLMVVNQGLMVYSKSMMQIIDEETNSIYNEQGQLLLSALVSAVSTSMAETLGKSQQLKQIEYGSQKVMIEKEGELELLILADRETSDLRKRMNEFLQNTIAKGFKTKFAKGVHLTEEFEAFFDPLVDEHFKVFFPD